MDEYLHSIVYADINSCSCPKRLANLCVVSKRTPKGDTRSLIISWWRHQMETFSALLAICAGKSPVSGEFPAQRPVTRSFDVFFDVRLIKRLSKHSRGWWFGTLSHPLWRHRNVPIVLFHHDAEISTYSCWYSGNILHEILFHRLCVGLPVSRGNDISY